MLKKFLVYLLIAVQVIHCTPAGADSLEINLSPVPLHSRLKGDYIGYKYNISNRSNQVIDLVNAQIINGQDGAIASAAAADGNGVGSMWAIMGPAGIFSFGITWIVGIVATPIMLVTDSGRNKKARKEGQAFSNIVNLGKLASGESTTVQTLVPIGAQPQLKLTYQEPDSKELLMVSR